MLSLFAMTRLAQSSLRPLSTSPTSSSTAASSPAAASKKPPTTIRTLIKEYGPIAFITYSLVSTVSLTIWYTAIRAGVDVSPVVKLFSSIRDTLTSWVDSMVVKVVPEEGEMIGKVRMEGRRVLEGVELAILRVEASFVEGVAGVADGMVDVVEGVRDGGMRQFADHPGRVPSPTKGANITPHPPALPSNVISLPGANPLSNFYAEHGTTVLVAIAAHNIILPIRVGLTALLTPWVAARLRSWGFLRFFMRPAANVTAKKIL
ncbi:hypothetical protein HDU97_000597 [Phlyctochytrium planicorne]|nr:hypothetical protein HDU97_000597 [Phlyctochytrium planicorne]